MAGARTSNGGSGRPLQTADEYGDGVHVVPFVGRKRATMHGMMDGMDGMMWGMGLVWLLVIVLLALGIAALLRYLLSRGP